MEKFDPNVDYQHKYLKYKLKYQNAKDELEGGGSGDRYLLVCYNDFESKTYKKINELKLSGKNILKNEFIDMANENENTFIYYLEKKIVYKKNATKYIVSQPKEITNNININIKPGVKMTVESNSGVTFQQIINNINDLSEKKLDISKIVLYLINVNMGKKNDFKTVSKDELVHKA